MTQIAVLHRSIMLSSAPSCLLNKTCPCSYPTPVVLSHSTYQKLPLSILICAVWEEVHPDCIDTYNQTGELIRSTAFAKKASKTVKLECVRDEKTKYVLGGKTTNNASPGGFFKAEISNLHAIRSSLFWLLCNSNNCSGYYRGYEKYCKNQRGTVNKNFLRTSASNHQSVTKN